MVCSAEDDFTCSAATEVPYFAIIGLTICSAVCSMIGCSGLAVSSIICFTMGCSGCTGLGDVGIVLVWPDEEESLLKMFVLRPRRSCSSLESSMSIITVGEEAGTISCIGLGGCTRV